MDINELQAFVAVAESSSFSHAADVLHITQPAISKRISNLESLLGIRLFDRIGRTVMLTEGGRALMPRARKILMEVEDTRRALSNLQGHVTGKLNLGTSHHIGLHRLPPVLRSFTSTYPDVQLDMKFIDSEEAFAGVSQGELEIGIITLPPEPPERFELIPIWRDPLCVVVCKSHPLLQRSRVTLKHLAQQVAVLPSESTFTRRIVEGLFQKAGLTINVAIETNYLETIRMMVGIGLGWSVLPATMVNDDVEILAVPQLQLERQLGVVFHPAHSLSNAAQAMIRVLMENGKH